MHVWDVPSMESKQREILYILYIYIYIYILSNRFDSETTPSPSNKHPSLSHISYTPKQKQKGTFFYSIKTHDTTTNGIIEEIERER